MTMPPNKEIIPPKYGWEPSTYYLVEVSFDEGNPIHRVIFYSGFLQADDRDKANIKHVPAGYNELWSPNYERLYKIENVYYLKVVKKIFTSSEMNSEDLK